MRARVFGIVAVSLLVFGATLQAQNAVQTIDDLDSPIGSAVTWQKLVANVFKGVHEDDQSNHWVTAHEKTLRQVGRKDRTVLPEETPLLSFEAIRVHGDGKRYVALLIEAESNSGDHPGGGAAVLAIFPEGSSEAQDVADVKEDMFCGFGDPATIALGPDDGFFIESTHSNSNQSYRITQLFHIRGGQLRSVDSIFTLNVRSACGGSFDEQLSWRTEDERGSARPVVAATVTLAPVADETSECEETQPPVVRKVFTGRYRFDKLKDRYDASSGDLDKLAAFNEKNL